MRKHESADELNPNALKDYIKDPEEGYRWEDFAQNSQRSKRCFVCKELAAFVETACGDNYHASCLINSNKEDTLCSKCEKHVSLEVFGILCGIC
jgi:hypothetical protein